MRLPFRLLAVIVLLLGGAETVTGQASPLEDFVKDIDQFRFDTRDKPNVKLYQWVVRPQLERLSVLNIDERDTLRDLYFEQATEITFGFVQEAIRDQQPGDVDSARLLLIETVNNEIQILAKDLLSLERGSPEQEEIVTLGRQYLSRLMIMNEEEGLNPTVRNSLDKTLNWAAHCTQIFLGSTSITQRVRQGVAPICPKQRAEYERRTARGER